MAKQEIAVIISDEVVMSKIYYIRGQKVMLDADLAELYQVETKSLKRAVNRNKDIFPNHFMFELTAQEFISLKSQFAISKTGRGGTRYSPMVFTQLGVLQLANVLKSSRARQMSIRILEVFVRLQSMLIENTELRLAIEKLERKTENNTKNIEIVFRYFDELLEKKENKKPRKKMGYKIPKTK
ncbi:MAG: ORF6N domain-containing protein [Bacteroidia bacterium]